MNILAYSNGWGHLIMSSLCLITGIVLILATTDPIIHATGIGLITTVSGYWFVTSSAKQIAVEIAKNTTRPLPPLDPVPSTTEGGVTAS